MKTSLILSLFLIIIGAAPALAGTTDCASAESSLSYQYKTSDGGAPIGPSEKLTLDGETLIELSPFAPVEIRDAGIEFLGKPKKVSQTQSGNYETRVYAQKARVTSLAATTADPLFADWVLCRSRRWVGPPIP